jgi:hypothetical protein
MKTYTFTLPSAHVDTLFQALGELPLKLSGPVFSLLQAQRIQQDAPQPVTSETT